MSERRPPPSNIDRVAIVPAYTAQPLDRADALRKDSTWVQARLADPGAAALLVTRQAIVVEAAGTRLARAPVPPDSRMSNVEALLLGLEPGGTALFVHDLGTDGSGDAVNATGAAVDLRALGARLPASESGLAAYAMALVNWHRRNRFCANCGAATQVRDGGYMRSCPGCATEHFPRLDPVVIMLVEHDGQLLLGRRPGWPARQYSALAGFVGPGETVEEAVVREVREESGIVAGEPVFIASQPWPFPASLMLGFHARCAGGDPRPRDGELEDVRWFTRDQLQVARETPDGPLKLPPRVTIARFLIERWLASSDRASNAR